MESQENRPIKIAYSWIGPKGPVINTELPTVMGFSAVGENSYVDSTKFWADDIYWRVFMHNGNFPISPSYNMSDEDVFIYPFTLSWRTHFNNYFLNNGGILEFSHTSNHIIHQARYKKGFFCIDYSPEAWVQDGHLHVMHSYFSHYNNIPMGKIIYITGCMNVQELYDEWCEKNKIPDDPLHRMIVVPFAVSQHSISCRMHEAESPVYDENHLPEKLFLCWNRRFRNHRTNLALALDKIGLVDRSYYSMHLVDPEMNTAHFKDTVDLYSNHYLGLNSEDANKFINKLPLVIDGETEIARMCGDFDRAARNFYHNSLVSIITETNFELSELTATEKTWKPAKEKHPFIMVGVAGALRSMQNLGFKTFDEFWDESYDEEQDYKLRLYKIVKVCKEISEWDNNKILDFKKKVKPIVEHNYNVLQQNSAKIVADKIRTEIFKRVK